MKMLKWFVCFLAILVWAAPVAANGAPVKIFLNHLPEFSNYGSTHATGVALVSFGEAWVDVQAEGLPQLSGQLYEAWLVKTQTNEMISLGKFNADADGRVAYHAEFDQLPEADYRYFAISVEPDPDPSPQADARRTIAGVFPNPDLLVIAGTPTSAIEPGVTPAPGAPAALPVTGEVDFQRLGGVALGLGFTFVVIGLLYGRK